MRALEPGVASPRGPGQSTRSPLDDVKGPPKLAALPPPENFPLLEQSALNAVTSLALARWTAAGLTGQQLATLRALSFEVADLPGLYLGEAEGNHIRVDNNAGGNGWFVDSTGSDDAQFAQQVSATRRYTDPASAPAGRIDLLTAILHEMGHALGLEDTYAAQDRDNLMYGFLTKGERRLPALNQALGATPHPGTATHFLSAPLTIGDLPAGKTVTITYVVTITSPAASITSQGTVSGGNFTSVVTNDPQTGAANDATVTPVELPPVVTDIAKSGNEDTQITFTAANFQAGYSDPNSDALASVRITSLPANGTLKLSGAGVSLNQDVPLANLGNLTFDPAADFFGSTSFGWNASDGTLLATSAALVNITVNPVADTPSVTGASTSEDTQTASGLVISRNAADGAEVTHFKITGISNGTLFQNDGTTPIANGDFITFAEGNAGLKFTPSANLYSPATSFGFSVQASISGVDAGLGGGVVSATVTVDGVADTPGVTGATTSEDTQTASGLVISRNAADGAEVTHFKITGITGGALFQNDGTTIINSGDFITFAQGNAGLKFTPSANLYSPATIFGFSVQASLSGVDAGLGGGVATATITVNPVADTPSVTDATTSEDTQTASGLVITRNTADGAEVTHFKITGITGGALFQNDGTTIINSGDFITVAEGSAGLKFTPVTDGYSPVLTFLFTVQASLSGVDAGLGGGTATATITVNPVADTPSVTDATTSEDTQTASGLVISRNAADSGEVTHFKITGITGGALFQNDGTTPINDNDFITFAEGNAGLRFTPAANSITDGHFTVQASTSAVDGGLGGGTATATITISPVADTPSVTNATTPEDTQTTSGLVISRNAADGAEITHFKITAILNGTLFQNDGTTAINNGDFITFAQGNAGLKFTPAADLSSPGTTFRFDAQASTSSVDAGLAGGVVTATITVTAVNDNPVAVTDTILRGANADTKVRISTLVANDTDVEGDTISFTGVISPSTGGATVTTIGDWVYYHHNGTTADTFS
ncbi:MAG TPA: Ig-like domain-containing protein, partial [Verrucomicrobiae bacterium]|nr:Ig-like domain-containing protein [Verrucomicrobiae bacterium]